MVTSVRRRRNDLAILKTLGFTRRQRREAVAWQSTTLVVIAFAIGLPLGAIGGRGMWRVFAEQLGVVPTPCSRWPPSPSPPPSDYIVASVPAWGASRVQPSRVFRAE